MIRHHCKFTNFYLIIQVVSECDERELATSNTKPELIQRLSEYFQKASEDPATSKFEVPCSVGELFAKL